MAFRAPDTQGRFYAQAASNAPSTASLIPPFPRGPQGVQAAFARAPLSIRTAPSANSLVRLPPTHSLSRLTRSTFPERLSVLRRNRRPVICIPSTITLQQGKPSLPPPSLPPISSFQFSLSPDPQSWGADLSPNHPEPDDFLHNPDPRRDRKSDRGGSVLTYRGLTNLGCLVFLAVGLVALLYVPFLQFDLILTRIQRRIPHDILFLHPLHLLCWRF